MFKKLFGKSDANAEDQQSQPAQNQSQDGDRNQRRPQNNRRQNSSRPQMARSGGGSSRSTRPYVKGEPEDDAMALARGVKPVKAPWQPSPPEAMQFFALGGMLHTGSNNMYVYEYQGKFIIIDCGIGFSDDRDPNVESRYPSAAFLKGKEKDIIGLVLTHGHGDHIGAVKYIWPQLQCPIYCGAMTQLALMSEFKDQKVDASKCEWHILNHLGGTYEMSPFKITTVHISHSIPEAMCMVVETPAGKIFHTGDWNFNANVLIEGPTDFAALEKQGTDPTLLAVIGDSTDTKTVGEITTELEVEQEILKIVKANPNKRVTIACYARAIARRFAIESVAAATGRKIVNLGRSMNEYFNIGMERQYFKHPELVISPEAAAQLPDSELLYVVAGTQGEEFSGMQRLCFGQHREFRFTAERDIVIFSARIIPGGEEAVCALYQALDRQGIQFVTWYDAPKIHAAGHGTRTNLEKFYQIVRPAAAIAMHGGLLQSFCHMRVAKNAGIKETLIPANGDVIRFQKGVAPKIVAKVPTDVVIREQRTTYLKSEKEAHHDADQSTVFVSLVVNKKGHLVQEPLLSTIGSIGFNKSWTGRLKSAIDEHLVEGSQNSVKLIESVTRIAQDVIRASLGRTYRPNVKVHIILV